jgi:hypothetical protein
VSALDAALADAVRAEVERRITDLQRPELVHQRNVEAVVGLPRRDYLRLARELAFPSTRERRLVVAKTKDVLEAFERRMRLPAANDGTPEFAHSRSGLRRVAR